MPKKKCIRRPIKRLEFKKYEAILRRLSHVNFDYDFSLLQCSSLLSVNDLTKYASYIPNDNLKSAIKLIATEWQEKYKGLDWAYTMHCLLDYMDKAFGPREGRIAPDPIFTTRRSQKSADRLIELLTDLKNKLKPFEPWYNAFYFHDEIGCKGDVLKAIDDLTKLIEDEKERETHHGPKGNMRKNVLVLRLWSHLVVKGRATPNEALDQITDLHFKLSGKTSGAIYEKQRLRKMATRAIERLLSIYTDK